MKVEVAQRAVLKVANKKPFRYPTNELYQDTNFLTVRQLYILAVILRFHKTAPYTALTKRPISRRNTWHVPTTNTRHAQRAYYYKGPTLYSHYERVFDLYNTTRFICKKKITSWLLTLNYSETESLVAFES